MEDELDDPAHYSKYSHQEKLEDELFGLPHYREQENAADDHLWVTRPVFADMNPQMNYGRNCLVYLCRTTRTYPSGPPRGGVGCPPGPVREKHLFLADDSLSNSA